MTKDKETQNMNQISTPEDGNKDKRIGTIMMHPVFGEITITDVRKIPGRTVAYYKGSFCNMNILTKLKETKS